MKAIVDTPLKEYVLFLWSKKGRTGALGDSGVHAEGSFKNDTDAKVDLLHEARTAKAMGGYHTVLAIITESGRTVCREYV